MTKENKREPLRVSLWILSTSLRMPKPKTKKPLLKKPLEKSRKERKTRLPKSKETRRLSTRKSRTPRKLKTRLPKRPKRRLLQQRRNDSVFKLQKITIRKYVMRSCLPQKNVKFSDLEEDILLCLVDDVATEVTADNAIPSTASLVHFVLQVPRNDPFLFAVLYWLLECLLHKLGHFRDFLCVHVSGLNIRLKISWGAHFDLRLM